MGKNTKRACVCVCCGPAQNGIHVQYTRQAPINSPSSSITRPNLRYTQIDHGAAYCAFAICYFTIAFDIIGVVNLLVSHKVSARESLILKRHVFSFASQSFELCDLCWSKPFPIIDRGNKKDRSNESNTPTEEEQILLQTVAKSVFVCVWMKYTFCFFSLLSERMCASSHNSRHFYLIKYHVFQVIISLLS